MRRPRLVSVLELVDREAVEEAWGRLQDAGIPAFVDGDPGLMGGPVVSRLMVEANYADASQRLIADIVRHQQEGGSHG
jgi:hypothetical protein